ncbi:MAG TPA: diguanylate cyclase [Gemmatimonadales bacterium]|nr:diguanylate cyclase [Gemmatimonadales bacterium]
MTQRRRSTDRLRAVSETRPFHVLVMGDGGPLRSVLDTLHEARYRTTEVETVDAVLERNQAEACDLLLLDLSATGPGGVDAVKRVQAETPDLPVVVLADGEHEQLAFAAKAAGASDHLVAGRFDAMLLLRVLRHTLELSRSEAAYRLLQARYDALIRHSPDGICNLSVEGVVARTNLAFEALTEWSGQEWLGRTLIDVVHQDDRKIAQQAIRRAAGGEAPLPFDVRMATKSGGQVIGRITAAPVFYHNKPVALLATIRDVTQMRHIEVVEREAARTDHLTGLTNRRGCEEAIAREVARATRENSSVGFALFDLDHFKNVNDTYGHETGDAALRAVAKVLLATLRASDVAGRWGGEELIAILPSTSIEGTRQIAERARAGVQAIDSLPCALTVSAGTAEWSRGQDVAVVLARADRKLYDAKGAGRNKVM